MDWLQELSLNSLALLTFLSWYFSYAKHNVSDLAYNLVVRNAYNKKKLEGIL